MKTKTTIIDFIASTSHQKVLSYLSENFDRDHYDSEIARDIPDLSKASVNNALKELHAVGLIKRKYLGNIALNNIDRNSVLLKQYKVLINIARLGSVIDSIREHCDQIIMFGNASTGVNHQSDTIDLFIVTEQVRTVEKKIENCDIFSKLHLIIHTAKQALMFENEAPSFYANIQKGLHL